MPLWNLVCAVAYIIEWDSRYRKIASNPIIAKELRNKLFNIIVNKLQPFKRKMELNTGKWIRAIKARTFSPHLNYICLEKVKLNRRAAQLCRIQRSLLLLATPANVTAVNMKTKVEKLRVHSHLVPPSLGLVDKPRSSDLRQPSAPELANSNNKGS